MIPCQKCAYDNPLGTVFCRGCGVRIEVNLNMVKMAVKGTNTANLDSDIYKWGRSAVSLCSFLLICALLLRYVAVPKPPAPDIPAAPDLELFSSAAPWAAKAIAAPPVPSSKSLIPEASRLAWRAQQGPAILSAFSIDLRPITDTLLFVAAKQKADGSFPGDQPLAATALAALTLQAWPREQAHRIAAEKARAWIKSQWKNLSNQPPLARALATAAMADAEALSDEQRAQLGVLLVDGSSPVWQAFLLPLLPTGKRPTMVALENKLTSPAWKAWFELLGGTPPTGPIKTWFSDYAITLTTGEDRFQWAQLAWLHPAVPEDFAVTLRSWNQQPPPPVSADLEKACGDLAKPALQVLTLTAPVRLPILRLSH